MKIFVEGKYKNMRLDLFLTQVQNLHSRSSIKHHLNEGLVQVNEKVEFRPNYKVREDDSIEITFLKTPEKKLKPEDIPLDIIYEDEDLIVINKPVGLVVHPATGNWEGTLMNGLLFHYQNMKNVGDTIRSGLIHRLDKDTSGLILIGKTNKGLWYYSKLFAERKVSKHYLAITTGNVGTMFKEKNFRVSNYLGRNPKMRKKFSEVNPLNGKLAETSFKLLKVFQIEKKDYSLVEATPKTGRTHQIRVHLSGLGFPVLGDNTYSRSKYSRLMLHAWKISLKLMDGEEKTFFAPIPAEFNIAKYEI